MSQLCNILPIKRGSALLIKVVIIAPRGKRRRLRQEPSRTATVPIFVVKDGCSLINYLLLLIVLLIVY